MKALGLVTRSFVDEDTGEELAAVYVPTAPNPTGGYLEIVPVGELVPLDWTVDEAMSFVLSGGTTAPDRIRFSRQSRTGEGDTSRLCPTGRQPETVEDDIEQPPSRAVPAQARG
jgi:uncharacterized membrane protein